MQRSIAPLLIVGALVCLPLASPIRADDAAKSKPAAAPAAPAAAVQVTTVERRALAAQTEFIGRVEAFEKVDLRARVTGFLRERKFEAGADVKKGEVLFVIEREPFEAVLAQRKAQLAAAEATEQNAAVALQRYETLESKQVASTAQLDTRIAEQKRAAASVAEAKAAIQDAEIKLSYTTIQAPITGRIGRSIIDPGNLVGPETGVLTTLVRTDKMHVLFPVTQMQLIQARKAGENAENLKIRARLADGTLVDEPGEIDFIDVKVDSRTDGQLVRAVFPNSKNSLVDGQTVRLVIERKDPDAVISIPTSAISTDQAGQFVFTVGKDNVVHQKRVKLGTSRDGFVAVTEGLAEGDKVIVQGLQKVRDGVTVTTTEADTINGRKVEAPKAVEKAGDAKANGNQEKSK